MQVNSGVWARIERAEQAANRQLAQTSERYARFVSTVAADEQPKGLYRDGKIVAWRSDD